MKCTQCNNDLDNNEMLHQAMVLNNIEIAKEYIKKIINTLPKGHECAELANSAAKSLSRIKPPL
jgi:hypothetical protein